jgi:hypothetical protein
MSDIRNTPAHPDAEQDYSEIMDVIGKKVGPAFDMIGQRLSALEQENSELKDIVYSMITAMDEGVSSYKKNGLMNDLSSKYGRDLEPYKGIYSDTRGSDLMEDLISHLMESDGAMDEKVPAFLEELKGKFGKYLPGESSITVAKSEPAEGENPEAEPEAASEKPEEEKQNILPFEQLKADVRKRMGM